MSKIFDRIRNEHITELIPAVADMRLKKGVQRPLWAGYDNTAHIKMGLFYELMTAGLFGGELIDSLIKSEECEYGGLKPDILDEGGRMVYESKANRMGHQLNLLYDQVRRYRTFMVKYPQYRIAFVIWRHGFKAIKSTDKDVVELFKELSGLTYAGLVLPFSLIMQLHKNPKLKVYENGPWHDCTRVNSTVINGFIIDPEEAIAKYGADPINYTYTRYVLRNGFYVDGYKINSFPLTYIEDKNFKKWRRVFLDTPPF